MLLRWFIRKTTVEPGASGGEAGLVGEAEPHAVEELRHPLREPVADAEVEVGVEGGDDLARVALDPRSSDLRAASPARGRARSTASTTSGS